MDDKDVLVETSKENSKSDVGETRKDESQINGGGTLSRKLKSQKGSPKSHGNIDLTFFCKNWL